jgi:translation initiation factor IF-1
LIDGGEKAIAIRDKKYTYGDYVTVRFGDADPEKCEVIYEPIG